MGLTYEESASLMADMVFRGRIKCAGLKYATFIQNEQPNVEAHSARYRWAQQMANAPEDTAMRLQPMVVMDASVQDAGSDITDASLQTTVETVVNKFL